MASSSLEAIPVKLPVPPSLPQKPDNYGHVKNCSGSVADRALASLKGGDVASTLDVHIRWTVESGSIVQKGEKIAQLFYSFHGSPPPPPSASSSANSGNAVPTIIRARTKKKRWSQTTLSAETLNKTQTKSGATSQDNSFVSLAIRADADGFLRIIYTKPFAFNAIQINPMASSRNTAINLILAAIEPCEHPAVVGGLCAVCGADTRSLNGNDVRLDEHIPKPQKQHDHTAKIEPKRAITKNPPNDRVDVRQQRIIDNQKKLAASMASSKEFDTENDDEFAEFDMDAAIASHAQGSKPSTTTPSKPLDPAPLPKITKTPSNVPKITRKPSNGMRSLSSLLSGAKATQQMQQIPTKQKQPPKHRHAASRRPSRTAMSSTPSTNLSSNESDPKMSKMTVSGGVTITISESEGKNISDAFSKKLREEKKLALVLDLDHTLLHATDDYRAGRFVADEVLVKDRNEDKSGNKNEPARRPNPEKRKDVRSILLPVELPQAQQQQYVQQKLQQQFQEETNFCLSPLPQQKQNANSSIIMRHFVKLRPHLKEFFSKIQSSYQLSVYTAGTRSYAEQIAVMICRHLVGAALDEEGLTALRAKVREKDEECRKYRDYVARTGRKRQLEMLARGEENVDGDAADGGLKLDAKKNGSRKSVTFGRSDDGGKVEIKNDDKSGKSHATSKSKPFKNHAKNASNPAENNKVATANANQEPVVAANDGECAASSQLSSQKRSNPVEDGKSLIPRKKKRLNAGSLLTLLPTETESTEKGENLLSTEEEQLVNPSEERDQLRKDLEGAEKLEIAAVELRRKMFGSRIVSRTDVGDLGKDVKSLKRVFPCGGVMAAILDDREDVWANAENNATGRPGEPPDNLLLVKPYHWKPLIGYADVNNASGNDLSKTDDTQRLAGDKMDSKEDDVQLLWTADILRRLHERYYSTNQAGKEGVTVPSLLQSMRKETLLRFPQGKVVFSGLIPISKQNKQNKVRPHVVRYAEELGAEVLPRISQEVTYVVAARDGSEKIKQARKEVPRSYIVHTSWLMECYWSISRRDVGPHHMGPVPKQQAVSDKKDVRSKSESSNRNVISLLSDAEESGGDDSEDDFAADLEKEMMI